MWKAELPTGAGIKLNLKRETNRMESRNGFTMVELLCAIVVLNLLVAGFANMYRGQNKTVNSIEEWSEGDPVFYVVPNPNEMARTLGVPATLSKKRGGRVIRPSSNPPYEVEVLEMKRRFSKMEASAVFSHKLRSEDDS